MSVSFRKYSVFGVEFSSETGELDVTYEWKTAVCAPADLGLVGVDEDPGMAERAASTIAGNNALVCPANGLLMDEVDGSVWARLRIAR